MRKRACRVPIDEVPSWYVYAGARLARKPANPMGLEYVCVPRGRKTRRAMIAAIFSLLDSIFLSEISSSQEFSLASNPFRRQHSHTRLLGSWSITAVELHRNIFKSKPQQRDGWVGECVRDNSADTRLETWEREL